MAVSKQNDKRAKARTLYLSGQYTQKEIAGIVGTTEKSITAWKEEEGWEGLKMSLLTTRENELRRLYRILENVNTETLKDIDEGRKVNSKDADAVIKYTTAIKNLELETSIAEKVEVGTAFISLVRKDNLELSKEITKWFDIYLKSCIK